mgnify:CR=1 FL=1
MHLLLNKIQNELDKGKKNDNNTNDNNTNDNENDNKLKDKLKSITKELSPKTIRRNCSNDNFLKFQWPWTL